ncbi:MAG: hypothetical protein A6F72_00425 [Cycloclasticus sp. symbiont of Poecilosclerida sp. N]|nr:MAG: hypothetical protein A6F72_00425 [Cycloclasticus sp. symbiont of Poecilosclerida sp. N]
MQCKEFEFEYIAVPNEIAGDACEHLQACPTCRLFAEQQAMFEKRLDDVIQCDVAEGFRHLVREYVVNKRLSFWTAPRCSLALAASLFIAIGLVTGHQVTTRPNFPIDRMVVEHFDYDGSDSIQASHQINSQELAQISQQFGVRVTLEKGISYAEKCLIGDSFGLHMVYQYDGQPITVIYMPEMTLDATLPFYYAGLKGWVKPMNRGSIAVLAGSTANLPEEDFADRAIKWL